jgi:hypothetical protein
MKTSIVEDLAAEESWVAIMKKSLICGYHIARFVDCGSQQTRMRMFYGFFDPACKV